MASTLRRDHRRNPRQARAADRQTTFLDAAASLFEQLGYERVTMTAIAQRAGASIGALYDYFPDKPSLSRALLRRISGEVDTYWAGVLAGSEPDTALRADVFVDALLALVRERPVFVTLLSAPIAFARSPQARRTLRNTLRKALQSIDPRLRDERAAIGADVLVALLKGFLAAYQSAPAAARGTIIGDFKAIVRFYVTDTLV